MYYLHYLCVSVCVLCDVCEYVHALACIWGGDWKIFRSWFSPPTLVRQGLSRSSCALRVLI